MKDIFGVPSHEGDLIVFVYDDQFMMGTISECDDELGRLYVVEAEGRPYYTVIDENFINIGCIKEKYPQLFI